MHFIVDHHDRSQSACTQAGDGLQREQHIIGSLASFLKTEVAAKTFHDRGGFPNVTSCPVTDFENVFPLRFKRKVFIEARNTVGAGVCDADFFGDIGKQFWRKIAVLGLNILNDRDQGAFFLCMIGYDLISLLVERFI